MATRNTKTVSPRLPIETAQILESDYSSLTHGATEACKYYPLVRRAILVKFQSSFKLTKKERQQLAALELPSDCDQAMLIAIVQAKGIKLHDRIRRLDTVEFIVLLDLIRNDSLSKAGVTTDMNGDPV